MRFVPPAAHSHPSQASTCSQVERAGSILKRVFSAVMAARCMAGGVMALAWSVAVNINYAVNVSYVVY